MKGESKHAFTLTELLVLVPVTALLATMLFAVSNDAKQQLQAAACLNNMRQWGLGFMLYANDYRDCFPYDGDYTGGLICGVGTWFDVIPPYIGQKSLCNLYAAGTPPTPLTRSVWTCPSATNVTVQPTLSNPYFMYSMSVCWHSRFSFGGVSAPLVGFRRNRATSPATTILFCEQNDYQPTYGETRGDSLSSRSTDGTYDPSTGRHSGGLNFVLGDGHCEWIRVSDFCRNCPNQPYAWDDSSNGATKGDWCTRTPPPYHWWAFAGASSASQ